MFLWKCCFPPKLWVKLILKEDVIASCRGLAFYLHTTRADDSWLHSFLAVFNKRAKAWPSLENRVIPDKGTAGGFPCKGLLLSYFMSHRSFKLSLINKTHSWFTKPFKNLLGDFPGGPVVKNLPSNTGDTGSIPGLGIKIPHAKGQLSLCVTTREPTSSNS